MRVKLIFLGAFLLLVLGGIAYDLWNTPTPIAVSEDLLLSKNTPVPKFEIVTLDGRKFVGINEILEENILINFWASWCTACVLELPVILNLVERSKGRLALLAISVDDSKEQMQKFLRRLNYESKNLVGHKNVYWVWDENKEISLNKFSILRVPETIIVNKERQMIRKIVGEFAWEDFKL